MSRYRTLTSVLVASAVCALALVSFPAPVASGDTPGCVGRAEFRRVDYYDMKKPRVHAIFDAVGTRAHIDSFGETRQYRACKGNTHSYVTVDYDANHRAWFKWMYVEGPATDDSVRCVTGREFRAVHRGMKKKRVVAVFDTFGGAGDGFAGGYTRLYQVCERPHRLVSITYRGNIGRPDRVAGKGYTRTPRQ